MLRQFAIRPCFSKNKATTSTYLWALSSLLFFATGSLHAADLLVPSQFSTIQSGITAANNGDRVLVSAGTYFENIEFEGKAIEVIAVSGSDLTTIDGSALTAGLDNGSTVRFLAGETNSSVLRGFTIQQGIGTFDNGDRAGGGIFCLASGPRLEGNIVSNNTAIRGGGIYTRNLPSPRIIGNHIIDNIAQYGGGFYTEESSPQVVSNLIANNLGVLEGGGAYIFFLANPTLTNNTFAANDSAIGGAVFCELFAAPYFYNCIAWGNNAPISPTIHENLSTPTIGNSNIEGGWLGLTDGANFDLDPLFIDASNGNYILSENSPLLDLALPDAPFLEDIDCNGNPRQICLGIDLGGCESPAPLTGCVIEFVRGDCQTNGQIEITDALELLSSLFQGTSLNCEAACDVNDDSAVDIADAVSLLEALFVEGSPAPAAPYPKCGVDPNGSNDCGSYASCP